jgi:sirohydrochlorin cobaltochelatase
MKAVILLGHGTKGPERPLLPVRAWTQAALPLARVEDAYLTQSPTLEDCVEGLRREGILEAAVVPLLVAAGHHVDHELPERLESLRRRWPELLLSQGPPLCGDAAVVELIKLRAIQAGKRVDISSVIL